MEPKMVILIGMKGIRLVRFVCKDDKEEEVVLGLYLKIKKFLRLIDKALEDPGKRAK